MNWVQGIDVSRHQGDVNFRLTMDAGMHFAFVKCSEGIGYTDPRFYENWNKLIQLNGSYLRGAYHFARPDTGGGERDGEREAIYFSSTLKRAGHFTRGSLPPVLDFEKYSVSGPPENIRWVHAFIRVVEHELGRKPIIYTGRNIWTYELGATDAFVDCPLWQVDYTAHRTKPKDMPWPSWTFWQWSGGRGKGFDFRFWFRQHGAMPGIDSGICDVNRFNGTIDELHRLAQLSNQPKTHRWKSACS